MSRLSQSSRSDHRQHCSDLQFQLSAPIGLTGSMRWVGLAHRGQRPGGPLYDWIKLGREHYFASDLVSMKKIATTVNAIVCCGMNPSCFKEPLLCFETGGNLARIG